MKSDKFRGVIPAMPTPFLDGKIDLESAQRLLEFLRAGKVHGVVICGSTGEGATVSDDEFGALLKLARGVVGREMPIIAGTGTNSTASTVARCKAAAGWGADALLVVTPYYNKPPQEGLFQHYKTVAAATDLPVILYNVPGRTACNLLPETVLRLAAVKNIVAIKEASGSLEQAMEIIAGCGDWFTVLTGEDGIFLPSLAIGCDGIISVMGNAAPGAMVELYEAWKRGDAARARTLAYELRELAKLLFIETNPIPLKAALQSMKIFRSAECRAPLCDMSGKNREKLEVCLAQLGRPA